MSNRRRPTSTESTAPPHTAKPPFGLSYSRELDERPSRLKALHEKHPIAGCSEFARLYEEAYGAHLSTDAVDEALLRASVSLRKKQRQESSERSHRIAALYAKMRNPTRDKLSAAYETAYGITLAADSIQEALGTAGIRHSEPRRKPDSDEVAARPARLLELAQQHPEQTTTNSGKSMKLSMWTHVRPDFWH